MRILFAGIFLFLLSGFPLAGTTTVSGEYYNYFGSNLTLKPDSTFLYNWHFDLMGSWSAGTWTIRNDTIYFTVIPVYDTLSVRRDHKTKDTLILSSDNFSERFAPSDVHTLLTHQNSRSCPAKLCYRKERLYWILDNGKLWRKKTKGYWTEEKLPPYYEKRTAVASPVSVAGTYGNEMGDTLVINSDSTFEFYWHIHMSDGWSNGKWYVIKDTIYFQPVSVYDTVNVYSDDGTRSDSVFLSEDDTAQRFDTGMQITKSGAYWQTPEDVPVKLCMKKNRLYVILEDGTLEEKKIRLDVYPYNGKYASWYARK